MLTQSLANGHTAGGRRQHRVLIEGLARCLGSRVAGTLWRENARSALQP